MGKGSVKVRGAAEGVGVLGAEGPTIASAHGIQQGSFSLPASTMMTAQLDRHMVQGDSFTSPALAGEGSASRPSSCVRTDVWGDIVVLI